MDMYIRNVKIIEDAFEQIKEATGISSTEEIVTTFIKAEEQNYSLYNYVNMLNSEIDMIEEQNKMIEAEINKHEELGQMSEKEKETMRQNLQKNITDMQDQMNEKDSQIKEVEREMQAIKDSVQEMIGHFRNSQFFLSVAQNMHYDEETQFNENNVTQFLAELEEYIAMLITFMAYRQSNPDAAISSLSLEKMALKEFDRNPINVSEVTAINYVCRSKHLIVMM
jgi:chromosome segregation ATPase